MSESIRLTNSDKVAESNETNEIKDDNVLENIVDFWETTIAKLDPKNKDDPELQRLKKRFDVKKEILEETKRANRDNVKKREREKEIKMIEKEKEDLKNKLKQNIKECKDRRGIRLKKVYEKEIVEVLHDEEEVEQYNRELSILDKSDRIDKLLASVNFDYGYNESQVSNSEEGGLFSAFLEHEDEKKDDSTVYHCSDEDGALIQNIKNKKKEQETEEKIDQKTLIPLETKVLHARHSEMVTNNHRDLAKRLHQKEVKRLYDVIFSIKNEKEQLYELYDSDEYKLKIEEMKETNEKLRKAYQEHAEAQEKMRRVLLDS